MPPVSRAALVDRIDAALAASRDLNGPGLRLRSHIAVQRADAITHVIERLDAFAELLVYNPTRALQMDVRREHARNIVDAVAALLKPRDPEGR